MQKISKNDYNTFKEKFGIKDHPWETDSANFKKTQKYIRFCKWIPGIRMVAVCNSVSMYASKETSDIDLFVITSPKRMWFVRIMMTVIFSILGLRKTKDNHAWQFCLSFFVSTDGCNLSGIALEKDIYLYYWVLFLKPVLDYDDTYDEFLQQNTSWMDVSSYGNILDDAKKYLTFTWKTKGERFLLINSIDLLFKHIFLPKTLDSYKKLWEPFGIVINDSMLKFHDQDIRKECG